MISELQIGKAMDIIHELIEQDDTHAHHVIDEIYRITSENYVNRCNRNALERARQQRGE